MNKLITILALSIILTGCGNTPEPKKPEAECTAQVQQIGTLSQENEQLKAQMVEKDKKIVWLREQAKKAGANLNGNTQANTNK